MPIYPIQKIVEIEGEAFARAIADRLYETVSDTLLKLDNLHRVRSRLPDMTDEDWETVEAAIKWKIIEKLAAQIQTSAEGWCEVYYRDLKRKYEEGT